MPHPFPNTNWRAATNWLEAFKRKYESRYPGWTSLEPPRDADHAALFHCAHPRNHAERYPPHERLSPTSIINLVSRSSSPQTLQERGFDVVVDGTVVTLERLRAWCQSPLFGVSVAGVREADVVVEEEGGLARPERVVVANVWGVDEEAFVEGVRVRVSAAREGGTLDLSLEVEVDGVTVWRVREFKPVYGGLEGRGARGRGGLSAPMGR